jgi:hypothetical protein
MDLVAAFGRAGEPDTADGRRRRSLTRDVWRFHGCSLTKTVAGPLATMM